jgi:hypothetical protein
LFLGQSLTGTAKKAVMNDSGSYIFTQQRGSS